MAKQERVPSYMTTGEKSRIERYAQETTGESLSSLLRRTVLEKVYAWEERERMVNAQMGAQQ